MMREKEIMERLQRDIVIPDIVQKKAENALDTIKRENSRMVRYPSGRKKWKTLWVAVAAAVFLLGTMSVCAAYLRQSKGLAAQLHMTKEQQQLLEARQYTYPVADNQETENSVTAGGITVALQQVIVDKRFAWLSFQVKGYDLAEGKEPCFDTCATVDNGSSVGYNSSGHFYNGVHFDREKGIFVYDDDGTSAEDADGRVIEKYKDEEGCMEYIMMLCASDQESLVGATMHIKFQGLGTVYKADYTPDIEAVWEFDIELKGSDAVRSMPLSAPLGESGAAVAYAEISPISLYVEYQFPLKEEEIEAIDQNGETYMTTTFAEPPYLTGVRLKDGTLLTGIAGGGTAGYLRDHAVYTVSCALQNIIDTEQVDALLFIKDYPEGDGGLTEENLYVVPVE